MNLIQKSTLKKTKTSIPKTENPFRLNFLNNDKRCEQTKKRPEKKWTLDFKLNQKKYTFGSVLIIYLKDENVMMEVIIWVLIDALLDVMEDRNNSTIFSFAQYGHFATISQLADPMAAKAAKDKDKRDKMETKK